MDAVVGLLLLLLLGTSHGWETFCDGRQKRAECFGPLGGTLNLRLMDDASEIFRYELYRSSSSTVILSGRRIKFELKGFEDRSSFTPGNGTLKINNLNSNDVGEYELRIFKETGALSENRTQQLTIQVPVSSVQMFPECLSQGEMRVFCSSKGDSPQYSWTLDGRPLTSQLLSGHDQNITLKQNVEGRLVCTAQNQVSVVSKGVSISSCGFEWTECTLLNGTYISQWLRPSNETQCIHTTTAGGKETVSNKPSINITSSNHTGISPSSDDPWFISYLPIMGGVLSALLLLLAVGVAVVYTQRKKQSRPTGNDEEKDVTYADVRIVQQQGRQKQRREESEVEYGQVKFSKGPRRTVEPPGPESLYAVVRRDR